MVVLKVGVFGIMGSCPWDVRDRTWASLMQQQPPPHDVVTLV